MWIRKVGVGDKSGKLLLGMREGAGGGGVGGNGAR